MNCSLGDVVDLSGTGARFSCKSKPPIAVGEVITIKLRFADGAMKLQGQAAWLRKAGFRRYEIGFRFVQLKRGEARALDMLARFGFIGADRGVNGSSSSRPGNGKIRASAELPDYYNILGVPADATENEIKSAFRTLASQCHPDVARDDPDAARKFVHVHAAYEVLSDPKRRAMFDLRSAA